MDQASAPAAAPASKAMASPSDKRSSNFKHIIIALVVLSLACIFGAIISSKFFPDSLVSRLKSLNNKKVIMKVNINYENAIEPAELLIARQDLLDNSDKVDAGKGDSGKTQHASGGENTFSTEQLMKQMQKNQLSIRTGPKLRTFFIAATVVMMLVTLVVLGIVFSSELLSMVGLRGEDQLLANQQ